MTQRSDTQIADVARIGGYWILTPPGVGITKCSRVVLDSNVLIDTRNWFRGKSRNAVGVAELWSWLRGVVRQARQELGDEWCLPITFPALLEATWEHGELGPDPDEVAGYLAQVATIARWDTSTFRNRRSRAVKGQPLAIDERFLARYRQSLSGNRLDYLPELVADWASVVLLFPFLGRAAATKSVKERLTLIEEWRDLRALRGVGASSEVKLLAQYTIFGGAERATGDRRTHEPANLLKRNEWAKHGVARVSRNVTFDLKVLRIYRETISHGQPGPGPQPTALVTGDGGLAALHSLIEAPVHTGEIFNLGPEEGWGAITRLPERSKLKDYFEVVSDERQTASCWRTLYPCNSSLPRRN